MATGSAAQYTAYTGPHGSLHQTNVLITFISSSAGWIYPIDRFFGRALHGKRTCSICIYIHYLQTYGPGYIFDLLYFCAQSIIMILILLTVLARKRFRKEISFSMKAIATW